MMCDTHAAKLNALIAERGMGTLVEQCAEMDIYDRMMELLGDDPISIFDPMMFIHVTLVTSMILQFGPACTFPDRHGRQLCEMCLTEKLHDRLCTDKKNCDMNIDRWLAGIVDAAKESMDLWMQECVKH